MLSIHKQIKGYFLHEWRVGPKLGWLAIVTPSMANNRFHYKGNKERQLGDVNAQIVT